MLDPRAVIAGPGSATQQGSGLPQQRLGSRLPARPSGVHGRSWSTATIPLLRLALTASDEPAPHRVLHARLQNRSVGRAACRADCSQDAVIAHVYRGLRPLSLDSMGVVT